MMQIHSFDYGVSLYATVHQFIGYCIYLFFIPVIISCQFNLIDIIKLTEKTQNLLWAVFNVKAQKLRNWVSEVLGPCEFEVPKTLEFQGLEG